jgi:hypothetical protein
MKTSSWWATTPRREIIWDSIPQNLDRGPDIPGSRIIHISPDRLILMQGWNQANESWLYHLLQVFWKQRPSQKGGFHWACSPINEYAAVDSNSLWLAIAWMSESQYSDHLASDMQLLHLWRDLANDLDMSFESLSNLGQFKFKFQSTYFLQVPEGNSTMYYICSPLVWHSFHSF